jgi:hypothetical protein
MQEVKGNSKCPCESGKRYAQCCKKKRLKWFTDNDGGHKEVPLVPAAVELLEKQKAEYQRIFERQPNKEKDPVFLMCYLFSDEETQRLTVEAMRGAGTSPELIYAYQKTGGLLITDSNQDLTTTKDLSDWNEAIDEYFLLLKNPPLPSQTERLFASLEEELESCIICTGYILDLGVDGALGRAVSSSLLFTVDDYVLLCATKSIKTLRAIRALINQNIGSDCLPLAR